MTDSARGQAHGYFMLMFDPNLQISDIVWSAKEAYLGRSNTKKAASTPHFCELGDFKNVSRIHGHISFDQASQMWKITVLGSKGAYIKNQAVCHNQSVLLAVNKPTPIQMGNSRFYFCPAAAAN